MQRQILSQVVWSLALSTLALLANAADAVPSANPQGLTPDQGKVDFRWGVKIPLRDGVQLNATVYTPRGQKEPAPCIFTLTPYISQS